ncbi:hypothetical protein Tco_0861315 [Tanacetum coccineum]|uniref:Uncharacterized protein n=1 Tax=Tanacetum coccineum TaxID=301880 RepID=A0ABQ5BI93_9ASTR
MVMKRSYAEGTLLSTPILTGHRPEDLRFYRDAPYRPTFGVLTKEVFKDPAICKTIVDHFPTPREMVRVEGLSDDQLTAKMSVLHCMMMSHGDKLATSDASFAKSKAKGKERKKKIKSLSKSLDNLHSEVARLSAALNQATILEVERDEDDSEAEDAPLKFFPSFRGNIQGVMLLEPLRVITSTYIPENRGSPEHCPHSKRDTRCDGGLFLVVSERISFVPTDVVVALSVGGKGDGSVPSSIVEEVVVPPFGV